MSLALTGDLQAQKTLKKRVAVFTFTDKTDKTFSWFDAKKSPGQGMADMLITELVQSGKYTVLERTELDEVFKEQGLGEGDRVGDAVVDFLDFVRASSGDEGAQDRLDEKDKTSSTEESKAKRNELLGAEIAVIGAITEFGYKGADTGAITKRLGVGVKSQAAVVGMDIRLVNTSTGEILAAEKIRRDKSKRGLSFKTPKLGFANKNAFDESMVGKATREAIEDIVKLVNKYADELEWRAKVVTLAGGNVVINAGKTAGVNVGDKFVINRAGEALIDPDTGLNLGSIESTIAEIEVVNNGVGEGKASMCKVISGNGIERGDIVKELKK